MYHGIINVYKEAGFTSHDVVAKLRGICKQKKIGHTGTLDPDAVGVLPVCLGSGTKLCDMLTGETKEYIAGFRLGIATDTQDISGKILEEKEVCVSAEQVKEMAVYKARAEAAEGAATDLCGDFVDFVCEGVGGNAAEYCANRSAECVDAYGECDMGSRFCKGFFPEAAREWTKRSIQEE